MGSSLAHDVREAQRHEYRRNPTADEALQQSFNQTKTNITDSELMIRIRILPVMNTQQIRIRKHCI
jgi:hypothetical protein